MNIILGFLLFLASLIVGVILSRKYSKRTTLFSEFCAFNQVLISEVEFSQNTLKSIVEKVPDGNFIVLIREYFYNKKLSKIEYLNDEEIDLVLTYFNNIGGQDKHSQLQYLKKIDIDINKRLVCCKNEMKKYKTLYIKIGFLIGIVLFVLVL